MSGTNSDDAEYRGTSNKNPSATSFNDGEEATARNFEREDRETSKSEATGRIPKSELPLNIEKSLVQFNLILMVIVRRSR